MAGNEVQEMKKGKESRSNLRNDLPVPDSVMKTEIIPGLDLKSKFRLRWVNKYFHGLVSDHLRHQYGSLPGKVIGLFFTEPIKFDDSYLYALVDNDADTYITEIGNNSSLQTDPSSICGCCNGLLLLLDDYLEFYVCNPLTRRSVKIPDPPGKRCWSLLNSYSALAFEDPRSIYGGSYNVLCFINNPSTVQVFSSVTTSWISSLFPDILRFHEGIPPFFFSGKVHHIAIEKKTSSSSHIVLEFDRDGYLIGKIKLPEDPNMLTSYGKNCQLLGHSGGRLRYAVIRNQEMVVWDLQEDNCSWVLKHSVRFEDIWDLMFSLPFGCPEGLSIMQFHPDKDLVFLGLKDYLFSYDVNNSNLVYLCFCHAVDLYRHAFAYSPYFSDDMDL